MLLTCECGKTFTSSQKFGGHACHCKEHLSAIGRYEQSFHNPVNKQSHITATRNYKLTQWIAEKHTCEKCGNTMTEKFGSGRFCSQVCANSHSKSEEERKRISDSVRQSISTKGITEHNISEYMQSPKRCPICNTVIPYEKRENSTCSVLCGNKLQSIKMTDKIEQGITHTNVRHKYKYGTYKGYECDSSWELAFIMYCLDHNVNVTRNRNKSFVYTYKGKEHRFFPDFIIDNVFYEIKNYPSELTDAKFNAASKEVSIRILYWNDIKKYVRYCEDTYGKEYFKLYDRSYPSWMDNIAV